VAAIVRSLSLVTALNALHAMTGCGFASPGAGPEAPGAPDVIPPSPTPPAPEPCRSDEQGVALCVDFEDKPLASLASDRSPYGNHAAAIDVGSMIRLPGEQAARLGATSSLRVNETQTLDLPTFTIEMWIFPEVQPPEEEDAGLFDNFGQYKLRLTDELRVRCGLIGDNEVTTEGAVPQQAWSHVACRYAAGEVRVYLNGHLSACRTVGASADIGLFGSAIGGKLALISGATVTVKDRLIGGLDNVRIYNRALEEARICAAAGQLPGSCETECPSSDESSSGSGSDGD
jgi:Concanavalin A-like lectin/glucanases superfamily